MAFCLYRDEVYLFERQDKDGTCIIGSHRPRPGLTLYTDRWPRWQQRVSSDIVRGPFTLIFRYELEGRLFYVQYRYKDSQFCFQASDILWALDHGFDSYDRGDCCGVLDIADPEAAGKQRFYLFGDGGQGCPVKGMKECTKEEFLNFWHEYCDAVEYAFTERP